MLSCNLLAFRNESIIQGKGRRGAELGVLLSRGVQTLGAFPAKPVVRDRRDIGEVLLAPGHLDGRSIAHDLRAGVAGRNTSCQGGARCGQWLGKEGASRLFCLRTASAAQFQWVE